MAGSGGLAWPTAAMERRLRRRLGAKEEDWPVVLQRGLAGAAGGEQGGGARRKGGAGKGRCSGLVAAAGGGSGRRRGAEKGRVVGAALFARLVLFWAKQGSAGAGGPRRGTGEAGGGGATVGAGGGGGGR